MKRSWVEGWQDTIDIILRLKAGVFASLFYNRPATSRLPPTGSRTSLHTLIGK